MNDMSYDCTHSGHIDFSLAGTDSIVTSIHKYAGHVKTHDFSQQSLGVF